MAATQAGAAAPTLLNVRGMIDTGATITAVAPGAITQLNVPRGPAVDTTTASGFVRVYLYQISFTIYDLMSGVTLNRDIWTVTNLLRDLDDVDILFGLDLLPEIMLIVDGPGQTFSLDF